MAVVLVIAFVGSAVAADHVIERSVIKGVGYRSHELYGQTASGYSGQKITEKISGSGSFYDKTNFELDVLGNSINYTQDAQFEYYPVSYQTGSYDQKWTDKLCVINYDAGAVATEMYTHAEHLEKSTEVRTLGYSSTRSDAVLEIEMNSNVIGVAHIGWVSKETAPDNKGRYAEIGRSQEDLTGVFSIEKYVQLMKSSTNSTSVDDWLGCG